MNEDDGAVNEAVKHGKSIARSHRHMKVDLAWLIYKLHGEATSKSFNPNDEVRAIFFAEARNAKHTHNISPNSGGHDNVAKFANLTSR